MGFITPYDIVKTYQGEHELGKVATSHANAILIYEHFKDVKNSLTFYEPWYFIKDPFQFSDLFKKQYSKICQTLGPRFPGIFCVHNHKSPDSDTQVGREGARIQATSLLGMILPKSG